MTLDPADFRREFAKEGQYIEFKRGVGQGTLQDTVVAFSNAAGGVILVGVEDDGAITGRRLDAGTEDAIHRTIRNVHDPGRYTLRELSVDGRPIVAISVDSRREGFSQTAKAVIKVRKGSRDDSLFGAELQRFVSRRYAKRFELNPTELTVADADPDRLAEVRAAFRWNGNDIGTRLEDRGLAEGNHLTIAGAMCLATDPAAALGKWPDPLKSVRPV